MVNLEGHLHLQRPMVPLRDASTKETVGTAISDVPDLVVVTGNSASSGASILMRTRRGQAFPGEPKLVWTISGEKGEIRITAEAEGTTLAFADPATLEVHDFATDEVRRVDWAWEPWQQELPLPGRAVAMLYERFAQDEGRGMPSFKDAVRRQVQLEKIVKAWTEKNKED